MIQTPCLTQSSLTLIQLWNNNGWFKIKVYLMSNQIYQTIFAHAFFLPKWFNASRDWADPEPCDTEYSTVIYAQKVQHIDWSHSNIITSNKLCTCHSWRGSNLPNTVPLGFTDERHSIQTWPKTFNYKYMHTKPEIKNFTTFDMYFYFYWSYNTVKFWM